MKSNKIIHKKLKYSKQNKKENAVKELLLYLIYNINSNVRSFFCVRQKFCNRID